MSIETTTYDVKLHNGFEKANGPLETLQVEAHGDISNGSEEFEDDELDDILDDISNDQGLCSLSHWIPQESITTYLKSKGINKLWPWQGECLNQQGVYRGGRNLVFSASTSAGKSLVAEILAIRHVFERKRKVMIILPFISIVREKLHHLKKMLKGTNVRVGGFMGTFHTKGGLDAVDIAICTNEKANSYINKLLEQNTLNVIGAIVVDEVHSISEPKRGPLLELMLTKILVACRKDRNLCIQLIAMSATLPNLDHLAKWLNAAEFSSDFRPVPLKEKIMIGRTIYTIGEEMDEENDGFEEEETIDENRLKEEKEADIYLTIRSLLRKKAVLLFLNDKLRLERLALKMSNKIKVLSQGEGNTAKLIRQVVNKDNIAKIQSLFKSCPIKVDPTLYECVEYGVGYHHGSLCLEHREILEESYKVGWIKILLTTSTLSAGVNLPASLVIIKSPKFLGRLMEPLVYRQMIGRAGRTGIDTCGESILLCAQEEDTLGKKLVRLPLQPVSSRMFNTDPTQPFEPVCKVVLEAIVSRLASCDDEIDSFLGSCYHFASEQADTKLIPQFRSTAISYLKEKNFITSANFKKGAYEASHLGSGTIAGSFNPQEGLKLLDNLFLARKGLVLSSDLHLLFLIIPDSYVNELEMDYVELTQLFNSWDVGHIPESHSDVMNAISLDPNIIQSQLATSNLTTSVKKFIVALVLNDLIKEISIDDLNKKYGLPKPQLQNLQNYAASFAGMVASFCDKLSWGSLGLIITRLVSQLTFGIGSELVDLMDISILTPRLARTFYQAQLTSVKDIARCSVQKLKSILMPTMEYNSAGRYEMWIESRKQIMSIDQLAAEIQLEARYSLQNVMVGAKKIDWEEEEQADLENTKARGPIRKRKKVKNDDESNDKSDAEAQVTLEI